MATESDNSILKNTSLITVCTLASRATGLIRTWAMAFALGNTILTSAYQIAYNLPAMIYELAASGFLATAFLPLYLLMKEKAGDEGAQRFSSNILTITLVVLGVLALACSVFAPLVIETQTFTQAESEAKDLAIFFFRVFSVQILLYGVGAVVSGILNAERDYLIPAITPVLNNIVVIITMFGFVPLSTMDAGFAMWWLAIGTSFGVLVQFGGQIPALIKKGFKYTPHINLKDPMIVEALKVALPMFLYIAGTMVTFSFRNAFALSAADNGPSTLNYAWMWFQLPYGVIAVSLSTTFLTELSDCAAKDDWDGFRNFVARGLRSTFFMLIPLASMLGSLAIPLMQIFQAGAFNADDAKFVGDVLAAWSLTLPFYAGYMYMYRVFAALRKFVLFAAIDFVVRLIQVFFYAYLTSVPEIGLAGIPIADFFFYGLMFVICSLIVRKQVGEYGNKGIIAMFIKCTIASVIAGAVTWALATFINGAIAVSGVAVIALALGIIVACGTIGLVIAFGLCKLMRVEEFSVLLRLGNKFKGLLKRG